MMAQLLLEDILGAQDSALKDLAASRLPALLELQSRLAKLYPEVC